MLLSARTALAAVALAIASGGCKRLVSSDDLPRGAVPVAPVPSAVPAPVQVAVSPAPLPATGGPMSFAPIAHKADPGVVLVSTVEATAEASPFFFGQTRVHESKGLGTGFLIDKDGTILTNNHVVNGADEITVTLNDERSFPAKVVGVDPPTDVAVIRISAPNLTPLTLGDSDAIDVGDWAVAIGNPFALSHTVSAGIISAKGRTTADVHLDDPTAYYNFLQTDTSINPGNSGGPLLNMKGEVVGINSAINPQANTIGFAIPINMVKQLLPMLLRDGHVTRSALGVVIFPVPVRQLTAEARTKLQVKDDHGLLVAQVAKNGAAEAAGIEPGDVILSFDGEQTDNDQRFRWLASIAGVGRQVTLRVERAGKVFDQKVTLGLLPDAPRGLASGRGRGGP